jgi:aryl-alcohol dehydrogenase-like predicted oxidoreductase
MVSEIGLGGHYDGPQHQQKKSKEQWQRETVFKECLNLGINYFDSNTEYERKSLGQCLKSVPEARNKIYIATDINDRMETGGDTYDFMIKKFDEQLHTLQLPNVDVLRFTSVIKRTPPERIEAAIKAFKKIKKDGKVSYFAIGQHDPDLFLDWINHYEEIDIIYTPYNYFAPKASEELFPAAKKKDLGVIVIKPFNKGTIFDPKLIEMMTMGSGTRSIMDRVEKEKQDRKPEDLTNGTKLTLAQASLRYILANENISMVIPGMETVDEVRENVQIAGSKEFGKSVEGLLERYAANFEYIVPNKYKWLYNWKNV